jgi:5-methylcytosine-specific restriction endonuclease McrA
MAAYKYGAAARCLAFDLTPEQFGEICSRACFYCDAPPVYRSTRSLNGSWTYNGIDRFDNAEGYTWANSVACCKPCNRAKHDMTFADFSTWIERLASKLRERGGTS